MRRGILPAVAAAGVAGAAAYVLIFRPWHLRWGATDREVAELLPGDELVPRPRLQATHAITIDAPARDVWPWVVQVGQGRGGFYSYTWLENLVGCRMRNANRVLPEFQHLKVGDEILFHPKAPPAKVTILEPGRALVIGESWAFVLRELGPNTTRLLIRGRGDNKPGLKGFLGWRVVFEPAHFIMERKMMLTIKRLAELRAAAGAAAAPLSEVRAASEESAAAAPPAP